ncbi:MAG: hypothetical protein GX363_03875 [Clostridiales bacterium]|jgi:hypothetical protein|nr:hypothetical protein [Clostridiales bacterium]
MNPVVILILLFVLGNSSTKGKALPAFKMSRPPIRPGYIDTFKMELFLDRLHNMTNALEKINHLTQAQRVPTKKGGPPSIDHVQESLDAIKGFLADGKTSRKVSQLSDTLSGAKKLGDMEDLISVMGPILSKLNNP